MFYLPNTMPGFPSRFIYVHIIFPSPAFPKAQNCLKYRFRPKAKPNGKSSRESHVRAAHAGIGRGKLLRWVRHIYSATSKNPRRYFLKSRSVTSSVQPPLRRSPGRRRNAHHCLFSSEDLQLSFRADDFISSYLPSRIYLRE
jgi:hypothetical protein